jgi:hypothetical protein
MKSSKNLIKKIHANRSLTIDELCQQCPEVSKTVLHEIVTKRLGSQKLCMHWVLKILTDDHKINRVDAAQAFLERYKDQGEDVRK